MKSILPLVSLNVALMLSSGCAGIEDSGSSDEDISSEASQSAKLKAHPTTKLIVGKCTFMANRFTSLDSDEEVRNSMDELLEPSTFSSARDPNVMQVCATAGVTQDSAVTIAFNAFGVLSQLEQVKQGDGDTSINGTVVDARSGRLILVQTALTEGLASTTTAPYCSAF
jgi:hypothetical protein